MVTAQRVGSALNYAFGGRLRDNANCGGEKIGCEHTRQVLLHLLGLPLQQIEELAAAGDI